MIHLSSNMLNHAWLKDDGHDDIRSSFRANNTIKNTS